MAHRLIAFYPAIAASDPTVFVAGLVMLLGNYPREVVESALSPLSGIPSKYKFIPSLVGVKEELEERYAPILRAAERERARNQTITHLRIAGPVTQRPTLEELKQKYGPTFGLTKVEDVDDERRQRRAAMTVRGNRIVLERDCREAGVDPDRGFSAALEKVLRKSKET
jgi:hypothetical protein